MCIRDSLSAIRDLRVTAAAAPYKVTLALSATEVAVDTTATYSGTATTAAGAPATGTVTVQKRLASGGAWGDWRTAKLDASGAYRVAVTMTNAPRDWQFRARMPGDGASNLTGLSAIRDLRVTAAAAPYKVTLALSATEVAVDTTATYSGTATTAAGAPATGTVTVQKRLASGGAWGDWRTAKLDASGAYRVAVTMTNAPRDWQFRARMPGDGASNLTGLSAIRDLRVTAAAAPYKVTLALSATEVAVDTTATYSGTATTAAGAPATGTVTVQKRLASGGAWGDWRTAKLDASGAYRVAVTMTNAPRDWQFRACMPGDGASNLTGLSAIRDLRVTAAAAPYKVTLALSATEVAVDTTATYSGTATTAAGAPATGTVTVQKRLASGGAWGDWRTAKLDASGAYRVAVTMTNAPRDWQFRARMPGDGASNLTGLSAIRDLRVTAAAAPYKVTLALSATEVAVDTTATYSGTATTAAGAPATGTVTVQKRLASGGAWGDWRTAKLDASGAYRVAVTMTNAPRDWQFRARMPGDGASNLTGLSAIRDLRVTAAAAPYKVTLALSATEVAVDTTATYSGTATTAAGAPATGTVTVQKRLASGGAWGDWRTAKLDASGAYRVAVTMTNAPRDWQFRARMPGDGASNLTGLSAIRDLRVTAAARLTAEQTSFTITGRGWGHGIGMSQWGAYGLAKHGSSYKTILKHYYTGIAFATVTNPTVRVRLRSGLQAVKLTCPADFTVQGSAAAVTIPVGTTATTTYVDGKYRVVAGEFSKDFTAAVTFAPTQGQLHLLPATDMQQTGPHRGKIRVVRSGTSLMMINHVALESYLRGVVPHEVSASWPTESLKAQACAARSYAERARRAATGQWDLYCDVRSQAYIGTSREDPRTDAAIKATAGVVPSYGGDPIHAFYFSCSGGHTENIELAWETSPLPYLKGVEDPYDSYATSVS